MVLVSSGYCFVLMAIFYWLIDYKGYNRYIGWLKVYGMNSIVAYMLATCVNFGSVSRSLFYGLQQYVGDFYPALIAHHRVPHSVRDVQAKGVLEDIGTPPITTPKVSSDSAPYAYMPRSRGVLGATPAPRS